MIYIFRVIIFAALPLGFFVAANAQSEEVPIAADFFGPAKIGPLSIHLLTDFEPQTPLDEYISQNQTNLVSSTLRIQPGWALFHSMRTLDIFLEDTELKLTALRDDFDKNLAQSNSDSSAGEFEKERDKALNSLIDEWALEVEGNP